MKDWDRKEKDHEKIDEMLDRITSEIVYDELLIPFSYFMSCKFRPRLTGLLLLIFGYQGDNPYFIQGARKALEERKRKGKTDQTKSDVK